jgi:nuclear pore complex protein Nup133
MPVVSRLIALQLYRQLVRALLQGKALPMEDVLDLLTLQDNGGENGLENYVVALDLLAHTTVSNAC